MAPKKTKSRSSSRSRSKTPTRGPLSSAKTKAKSRSSSRPRIKQTKTKAPSSESKIPRRRDSSSDSEIIPKKVENLSSRPGPSGDSKAIKPNPLISSLTPTRVSQRIVREIETRSSVTQNKPRSLSPQKHANNSAGRGCKLHGCLSKVGSWIRENICDRPIVSLFAMMVSIPLIYWLNLLILAPAIKNTSTTKTASIQPNSIYEFAGVVWSNDWTKYFNLISVIMALNLIILNALFARFVPIGYKVATIPGSRRMDYRCNGIFALIICMSLYAATTLKTHPVFKDIKSAHYLREHYLCFLTNFCMLSVFLAIVAYIKGRFLGRASQAPDGNTGYWYVDFWNGREVRPVWLGVDVKMLLVRLSVILLLVVDCAHVFGQLDRHGRVSPAMLCVTGFHAIYVLDQLLFERTILFSFEVQHEGVGLFMALKFLVLVPFVYSLPIAWMAAYPDLGRMPGQTVGCNCIAMGVAVVVYLVGLYVGRASNNQKDLVRRDPHHPSLAKLSIIPTSSGKRLLADGWWGCVRHPNYLGEIIMALATAIPAFTSGSIVPWIYPTWLMLSLVHRIWRDDEFCDEKHGACWEKYCKLVPYKLVPKVF